MKTLVLIPARGGSKGIPGKNIKPLGGIPLIHYSINVAKALFPVADICVSTDDEAIRSVAIEAGITVPFLRPAELSTDTAGTNEVLLHAVQWYAAQGQHYDNLLLLQPTSPFRRLQHIKEALAQYNTNTEMLTGVTETSANPYYVLFEEDKEGLLQKSKEGNFPRRQDSPRVWQINGALYLINIRKLLEKGNIGGLQKHKYVMDNIAGVDIDEPLDWMFAEFIVERKLFTPDYTL